MLYLSEIRQGRGKYCSHSCRSERTKRKWEINFAFFDTWTAELAYWIGLMLADGCVLNHRNKKGEHSKISFINTDKELTEFIRDCVSKRQKLFVQRKLGRKTLYQWKASSAKLARKLSEFGIIPRKSFTCQLPTIPKRFRWDLVRGILDGDGTVSKRAEIQFAGASKHFMIQLSDLLKTEGFRFLFSKRKDKEQYKICVRKRDSFRLAQLLYAKNPFCLIRKKERLGLHQLTLDY